MAEMSAEAKRARAEYMKKWRQQNPEKVKATQARYWERRAATTTDTNQNTTTD